MLAAAHAPAHGAPPIGGSTVIPPRTVSKVWKTIIAMIIVLILIGTGTAIVAKRPKNYDVANLRYGDKMEIKIPPGKTVRVSVAQYGVSPMYASDELTVYDNLGVKRQLIGSIICPAFGKGTPLTKLILINKEDHFITFKIGRCKSLQDCNIKF